MHETVRLTPAQVEFVSRNVPNFSRDAWKIETAARAGSERHFVRITHREVTSESYVLIIWAGRDADWHRFLAIHHDVSPHLPFLPHIYAHDETHGLILEEDLGSMTLGRFCTREGVSAHEIRHVYYRVLDELARWQALDPVSSKTISSRAMDLETFLWESRYFATHCVTEYFGCDKLLTPEWERERTNLALRAAQLPKVCIHRDFQSENIILRDDTVRFVDYQGARLGPAGYDVASLLCDPYAGYLDDVVLEPIMDHYYSAGGKSKREHREVFVVCAQQRLMQALGAYANLCIHRGKKRYERYIPEGLRRLRAVTEERDDMPSLVRILECCKEGLRDRGGAEAARGRD